MCLQSQFRKKVNTQFWPAEVCLFFTIVLTVILRHLSGDRKVRFVFSWFCRSYKLAWSLSFFFSNQGFSLFRWMIFIQKTEFASSAVITASPWRRNKKNVRFFRVTTNVSVVFWLSFSLRRKPNSKIVVVSVILQLRDKTNSSSYLYWPFMSHVTLSFKSIWSFK